MTAEKWIARGAILALGLALATTTRAASLTRSAVSVPLGANAQEEPESAKAEGGTSSTKPETEPGPKGGDLATTAPPDGATKDDGKLEVRPYLLVSGGVKGDTVKNR